MTVECEVIHINKQCRNKCHSGHDFNTHFYKETQWIKMILKPMNNMIYQQKTSKIRKQPLSIRKIPFIIFQIIMLGVFQISAYSSP